MSKKTTYLVDLPNGATAKRTSGRTYTHAIIGVNECVSGTWIVLSYAGNAALAQGRLNEFPGVKDKQIVPVRQF